MILGFLSMEAFWKNPLLIFHSSVTHSTPSEFVQSSCCVSNSDSKSCNSAVSCWYICIDCFSQWPWPSALRTEDCGRQISIQGNGTAEVETQHQLVRQTAAANSRPRIVAPNSSFYCVLCSESFHCTAS